jgi:4-amino-4-deoxy-L-arabinose transferase-like glycosyltransferase
VDRAAYRQVIGAVGVLIASAALFFPRLGDRAVVSEEFRWAEVAREMRLTGDWFHPTINGRTYYDKPIGSYWLILVASFWTGEVDETTARLPAAISAWLGVLLVMLVAARLYDGRTAVLAGAILATSFGFAFFARRATADMETTTGVLAAVWLYAFRRDSPSQRWVIILWLIMALTSLTKGLLGFALPIAVFVVHGVWSALVRPTTNKTLLSRSVDVLIKGNRWLFNRWTLVALPLGTALFLAPFAVSTWMSGSNAGLELLYRENLKRFFVPHNHTGPFFLYMGVVFLIAAPWSVFLPAALIPSRENNPNDRLALAYFGAVFAFFTLAASRRSYYLLPVLPAVALLVARCLQVPAERLPAVARALWSAGLALFALGLVLAGALLLPPTILPPPYDALPALPLRWAFAVVWVAGLSALAWVVLRRYNPTPWMVTAAFVAAGYVFLILLPAIEDYRTRRTFAASVRQVVGDDMSELALCDAQDIVFDLGARPPIKEYSTVAEAAEALQRGAVRWIVTPRRRWHDQAIPTEIVAAEAIQPWEKDESRGDKMMLLRRAGDPIR